MKKLGLLIMPLMAVSFLVSCNGGNTPSVDIHVVTEQEFNDACSFKNEQYLQCSIMSEAHDSPVYNTYEFSPTIYHSIFTNVPPNANKITSYNELFVRKNDGGTYEKATRDMEGGNYNFTSATETEFITIPSFSLLNTFEMLGINYSSFTYNAKEGFYSATVTPPQASETTMKLMFENKKIIGSTSDSTDGVARSETTYTYQSKTPEYPENPGPIGHSAISKISIESGGMEVYNVVFDYFADNQYIERVSLYEDYLRTYHIIEKTGDGGYVDYNAQAYFDEGNGLVFGKGSIDTYDANGKIISQVTLYTQEAIEDEYPGYDYSGLNYIDLPFGDFEETRFYYQNVVESSYNDNSALLKSVTKSIYCDEDAQTLSLVTTSVKENIYNIEGRLVKDYTCIAGGSIVGRVDYTYGANGLLTDDDGYILVPKGEDEEFATFIQAFDVNESSFEDYAQEPGFENLGPARARAYMYKETADPNTFETEYFRDAYLQNEYLLGNYEGINYGAYYKTTYGENGSFRDEVYAYELTNPEPERGQTRQELHFLDLTPGELKETHEVVYDDYQNCLKDVYTTIIAGVPVIVDESYEYTIDEDGKITNYATYFGGFASNNIVEYTTTDNDYGQTFGWVYNNVTKHTLV